jgi:hypothetical protein
MMILIFKEKNTLYCEGGLAATEGLFAEFRQGASRGGSGGPIIDDDEVEGEESERRTATKARNKKEQEGRGHGRTDFFSRKITMVRMQGSDCQYIFFCWACG